MRVIKIYLVFIQICVEMSTNHNIDQWCELRVNYVKTTALHLTWKRRSALLKGIAYQMLPQNKNENFHYPNVRFYSNSMLVKLRLSSLLHHTKGDVTEIIDRCQFLHSLHRPMTKRKQKNRCNVMNGQPVSRSHSALHFLS